MDKKGKKTLFNDMTDYKEFKKTDIGKQTRIFKIVGIIICLLSCFGIGYIIGYTDVEYSEYLFVLLMLSIMGAYLVGLYYGQVRYYSLTKNDKK